MIPFVLDLPLSGSFPHSRHQNSDSTTVYFLLGLCDNPFFIVYTLINLARFPQFNTILRSIEVSIPACHHSSPTTRVRVPAGKLFVQCCLTVFLNTWCASKNIVRWV